VASIMKTAAVSSTRPPRSVETDSRRPSTILVAYTAVTIGGLLQAHIGPGIEVL
jgi:hypothetical protein